MDQEKRWCIQCGKEIYANIGLGGRGHDKVFCSDACKKTRWWIENRWKYYDNCPKCGGEKRKYAKRCIRCRGSNNPTGINGR